MPSKALEKLLPYYRRELAYLREMGNTFAEEYPKIARRLEMGEGESADPHTERLIESLAFLAGRVQYNIEQDMPRITTGLFRVLYPQLVSPTPAQTIVHFETDFTQSIPEDGTPVDAGTHLYLDAPTGETCRFQTAYPTTLWPFSVREVAFEPRDKYDFLQSLDDIPSVLRIRLGCENGSFPDYDVDRLRFHLGGDPQVGMALYELLFGHGRRVALLPDQDAQPEFLPDEAIEPVGFGSDQAILPYPDHAHEGHRLLQEYATLPKKYLFFDLQHVDRHRSDDHVDILVLLDRRPDETLEVRPRNLRLGCTPAVNLFERTTEPIRLDHQSVEYRLVADRRREETTEIHSVQQVTSARDPSVGRSYAPYFAFRHEMQQENPVFWYDERRPHRRFEGTDVVMSFVDLEFDPSDPADEAVYAHVLCTNRRLPEEIPPRALYTSEEDLPVTSIIGLTKPTSPIDPPLGGETLWQLLSNLSLNHLSLSNQGESLDALREMLRLYGTGETVDLEQQLEGIRSMQTEPVTRHLRDKGWRGFCRGTQVTLTLDERSFVGSSPFLLGAVLARFFGLYASANSFSQLAIKTKQRDDVWKQWPPMAGEQALL
jgi:type VI secretion system protein ImpG